MGLDCYSKDNYYGCCLDGTLSRVRKFSTYSEQLELLKKRGVIFTGDAGELVAIEQLKVSNYYKIINGYKEFFVNAKKSRNAVDYFPDTHFAEIKALYDFDASLRFTVLKALLLFECEFKSILSYVFMEKHSPYGYINASSFRQQEKLNTNKGLQELLSEEIIKPIADSRRRNEAIEHFIENREAVPFYALISCLSFGTVVYFYKYMKSEERKEISTHFNLENSKNLSQLLNILCNIRNICAHSERLFPFVFAYSYRQKSGREKKKEFRLFDAIRNFSKLSSVPEIQNVEEDVTKLLKSLKNNINPKTFRAVLDRTGYFKFYKSI